MSASQVFLYACLIFGLMVTLASADTPIRKCANNKSPLPLMVQINDCNALPCELLKGQESSIAIQFVATRNAMHQLTAKVYLTSLGVTIPFELDAQRSNVCENLLHGAYCPLDAGEDVTYRLRLPVANTQPEVPTRLQVTLHDSERGNEVVACFMTDTRVRKA
ncbi:PREDICTED: epididymal secretory protein E1 [Drosophila arizonae]|uniref:Epididymal secretory protein E1 n=1 Tax=Drosophila arizonae TaxID=7263 RepID=A0ABM1Q1M5_DROAR|nr:PREDICTED: epididymal secretory protein E1 [Drosophila arizonae]